MECSIIVDLATGQHCHFELFFELLLGAVTWRVKRHEASMRLGQFVIGPIALYANDVLSFSQ